MLYADRHNGGTMHGDDNDDNVVLLPEDIVDEEVRELLTACMDSEKRPRSNRFNVVNVNSVGNVDAPSDASSLLELMNRYRERDVPGGGGPSARDDTFLQRKRDEFAEDIAFVDERLDSN